MHSGQVGGCCFPCPGAAGAARRPFSSFRLICRTPERFPAVLASAPLAGAARGLREATRLLGSPLLFSPSEPAWCWGIVWFCGRQSGEG